LNAILHKIAAVALLKEDGSVLMQHRDDKPNLPHKNLWVFPGGHCDQGEDFKQAAKRELLEETNYNATDLIYLNTVEYTLDPNHHYTLTAYWSIYDGQQKITCNEGQALKFLPRKEANNYEMPEFMLPLWDQAIEQMKCK
jgi:8-oxo-dGTP pyrophosphatase MutT (NUDIX family)